MRLSGVNPGIIRELSGIYKPFVKAFKELISNAYDADAKKIGITLDTDWTGMEVLDNGNGMTPFQFYRDFARLGGSTAWQLDGKSPGGRDRIGYKGIGFLAVARYCSELRVTTHSVQPYSGEETLLRRNRKTIPFTDLVGDLVPMEHLGGRVTIGEILLKADKSAVALTKKDYFVTASGIHLKSQRALEAASLVVGFEIDCRHITVDASLNFDYLLGLDHRADLQLLDDFCQMKLTYDAPPAPGFTRVRLEGLKDFVVRELGAPPLKGKARNIASKSGKEQFLWRLGRACPVRGALPENIRCPPIERVAAHQAAADLPTVMVKWRDDPSIPLQRSVYLPRDDEKTVNETVYPVAINEAGLRVSGYLIARSEVIYPAELRGLSIRVRNVAIGDASFLGWEATMSGPRKAALSQITGDLIVEKGIDAVDAINPGRESFYEENDHYRILKRTLFGSEETVGGIIADAIRSILDRGRVRSQVTEKLGEARKRRKTLVDISGAVNYFSRVDDPTARGLVAFLNSKTKANGLSDARDVPMRPRHKLAGFEVEIVEGLRSDYEINYHDRKVRLDFKQDTWDTTLYLNGQFYDLRLKQGSPEHAVCEFDNEQRCVFVNWAHPVKLHMDDEGFLRSTILLRLAQHASPHDANAMLDLALKMLAFRAE